MTDILVLPALRHFVRNSSRRFLVVVLALVACGAHAGTVWMDNGDRITGTISSLDNGVLVVNTSYGGDMRLQVKNVKTLQSDDNLVIRDKSKIREYLAKLQPADQQGNVQVVGVERTEDGDANFHDVVPLASLTSVAKPVPVIGPAAVKGRLDLSLAQVNGSTTSKNYAGTGTLNVTRGLWRDGLSASFQHSTADGAIGVDNYGFDNTLDRFITDQFFWEGRVRYRRDFVEDVTRQTAYGTGPGYQFWDDELGSFSLAALLGRVDYAYSDDSETNNWATSLRWNYTRNLDGKLLTAYTSGEVSKLIGAGLSLNGEVGLRYNLNNTLSVYLKYARNQVTGTRQSVNESIYGTGLGISF
jgi:hypothetical protein